MPVLAHGGILGEEYAWTEEPLKKVKHCESMKIIRKTLERCAKRMPQRKARVAILHNSCGCTIPHEPATAPRCMQPNLSVQDGLARGVVYESSIGGVVAANIP